MFQTKILLLAIHSRRDIQHLISLTTLPLVMSEWGVGDLPDSFMSSCASQDQIQLIGSVLLRNIKTFHINNHSILWDRSLQILRVSHFGGINGNKRWAHSRSQHLALDHIQLSILVVTSVPPLVHPTEMFIMVWARAWSGSLEVYPHFCATSVIYYSNRQDC